jgi:hypothetical protein
MLLLLTQTVLLNSLACLLDAQQFCALQKVDCAPLSKVLPMLTVLLNKAFNAAADCSCNDRHRQYAHRHKGEWEGLTGRPLCPAAVRCPEPSRLWHAALPL